MNSEGLRHVMALSQKARSDAKCVIIYAGSANGVSGEGMNKDACAEIQNAMVRMATDMGGTLTWGSVMLQKDRVTLTLSTKPLRALEKSPSIAMHHDGLTGDNGCQLVFREEIETPEMSEVEKILIQDEPNDFLASLVGPEQGKIYASYLRRNGLRLIINAETHEGRIASLNLAIQE